MFDTDDQLWDADGPKGPMVDAKEVDEAIDRIRSYDGSAKWQRNIELELKSKRWRPSAVAETGDAVLYVSLTGEVPRHIASRMGEAFDCGLQIHVALTIGALYSPHVLKVLAEVDADVFVLEDLNMEKRRARHFMAAMADLGVPAPPSVRTDICKAVYGRIEGGTSQQKGRRFEALISFLLSQITDFRVVDRNLRTATQELDIVIQIDHHSQRAWQQQVPYLLVEAKNWTEAVPQSVVSIFMNKIRTKGQSCKMGLLIATSGFTGDAKNEELRYSESENRIALIGPDELVQLVEAKDLDDTLDKVVRHARLR